jgi:hypothetical protein
MMCKVSHEPSGATGGKRTLTWDINVSRDLPDSAKKNPSIDYSEPIVSTGIYKF